MTLSALAPVSDLIVEGMPARAAKAITTTCLRAQTLQADGYKFTRSERAGVYECQKPPKFDKKTGEILQEFEPYRVDVCAQTCSCPGFGYYGTCKHSRACHQAVSEALELLLGTAPSGGDL